MSDGKRFLYAFSRSVEHSTSVYGPKYMIQSRKHTHRVTIVGGSIAWSGYDIGENGQEPETVESEPECMTYN